ncbi:MAG: hypothetical protein ABSA68_13980 [Xanthobacteraceae bacterium]|jgi:hypothetical protein
MRRLAIGGASLASPVRSEGELKSVLADLGVAQAFDQAGAHELYFRIGRIIGAWLAEQESMEVLPVAKALLSVARHLTDASKLLSGHETGLRSRVEIEVTSQTAKFLARDPAVGSLTKAQELISAFQREAARIGHVCMVAYADLAHEAGEGGRPVLGWYDGFTALLLEIADKAGVAPTLRKDRSNQARSGWLFEAAQALESFLYPWMRSPSAEACGKRLERSRKRLHRQNPHAR